MGVRINGVWHEELADPGTGGTDNGNGRNFSSVGDYQQAASGVTFSPNINHGQGSPGNPGPQIQNQNPGSALDAQYQKMLQALASGNAEAFQFEKDKFNQQFQEAVREYDLNRGDALSQFAQNFGLSVGQLTGMYNGLPTLAGQQQQANISGRYADYNTFAKTDPQAKALAAQNPALLNPQYQQTLLQSRGYVFYPGEDATSPTEQAREFNQSTYSNLGQSLLNAATQLRGPQDYLQYQQLTRGGQNLLQQLTGNQPIPQTAAPTGQLQSANLGTALSDLGFNPSSVDPRLGSLIQSILGGQDTGSAPAPTPQPPSAVGGVPTPTPQPAPVGRGFTGGVIGGQDTGSAPRMSFVPPSAIGGPNGGVYGGGYGFGAMPPGGDTGSAPKIGYVPPSAIGGSGVYGGGYGYGAAPPDTGAPPTGYVPPSDIGMYGGGGVNPSMLETLMGGGGLPAHGSTVSTGGNPAAMNAGGQSVPQQSPQQSILDRYGFGAGQSLNPNQINPARWDAMGNIGQSLTKNLAETYYGYDPTDFVSKINAQRPMGTAPRQTRTTYRQPTGLF